MQIRILFLCLFFLNLHLKAQENDTLTIELDTLSVGTKVYQNTDIINSVALQSVFEKLEQIDKNKKGKLRIVHVGDSHIQADFLTGAARENLQNRFGNAGLGFTFPHKLAKTNGNSHVKYNSNINFSSYRNIRPISNEPVGISGFSLTTSNPNLGIEVLINHPNFYANTIKIITPENDNMFQLALSSKIIKFNSFTTKTTVHKIKRGETLSQIAQKYKVTVSKLKTLNKLKNNNITAGKVLKIPTQVAQDSKLDRSQFVSMNLVSEPHSQSFYSTAQISKFYLLPNTDKKEFALNGLVLEKNNSGITYSGIGVNGAKLSDFNKFDLFFNQLQALNPDVLVVSFGTNESFDKMDVNDYMKEFLKFKTKALELNPNVVIIATTPPPSLLYRKYLNTYANDYANALVNSAVKNKDFAVWNMHYVFGGINGVDENLANGLMARDKVHYSKSGYEQQGKLFSDAFLKAYDNFILNK